MTNPSAAADASSSSWKEVRCALCVFSDAMSVSDVAAHVGIEPTKSRPRGSLGRAGRPVGTNQWIWQAPDEVPLSLDPQLHAIDTVLGPQAKRFRELASRATVVLDIAIYHMGDALRLGWVLKEDQVALAARFGAAIGIDEYDYTTP